VLNVSAAAVNVFLQVIWSFVQGSGHKDFAVMVLQGRVEELRGK
jgi:hypothetical protein